MLSYPKILFHSFFVFSVSSWLIFIISPASLIAICAPPRRMEHGAALFHSPALLERELPFTDVVNLTGAG